MIKNCPLTKWAKKNKDFAPVLLRLVVGAIFLAAGYGKLQGIAGVQGFFTQLGIPAAGLMAWVVALTEFLGGIGLLLGLGVRYFSVLLSFIMLVAVTTTKLSSGAVETGGWSIMQFLGNAGTRVDLLLFFSALSLVLLGAGPLSLGQKLCKKKSKKED